MQELTYELSGVSIEAQDAAISAFTALVEGTHSPRVLAGVGAFGAAFAPALSGLVEPVLISSTDGVGTKVRLHARFGTHAWAGRDLVAASLNDIVCSGALPLFFLDYIACHSVKPEVQRALVGGMAEACRECGCALIGGEIAEMGEIYQPGEYDLAGFGVGLVDRPAMLGAPLVQAGDALIGLGSSGVHCNGFALVRRIFEAEPDAWWLAPHSELGGSPRDIVLAPALSYAPAMARLRALPGLHAAAHISGGGLQDNVPRVVPQGLAARVARSRVPTPPVFAIIQRRGPVAVDEMWHVFNMGVGLVLIAAPEAAETILASAAELGLSAHVIGDIAPAKAGARFEWLD
jgi:phosphoribosylformylglycinamidine cyclo-ligase